VTLTQSKRSLADVENLDLFSAAVPESSTCQYQRAHWLPRRGARLAAFAAIRRQFSFLGTYLEASCLASIEACPTSLDGIVAWGGRFPARLARAYAELRGLPHWTLEDGFFRSVGLGAHDAAVVSLTVDDVGVHFSPASPSRLEFLLASRSASLTAAELSRARAFRELIVRERLSKYNHLPDKPLQLGTSRRRRILLVDQVRGDASVGRDGERAFARMWEKAKAENAELAVRVHPASGRKGGYLSDIAVHYPVRVVDEAVSPHAVLDVVDEVWTVSSQLGLDALLRGLPVTTFGAPFYAGWGLTQDCATDPVSLAAFERRHARVDLDQLIAVALLQYPLYVDPVHGVPVAAERAIERLVAWRNRALEVSGRYLCVGFARHKRKVVRAYLGSPGSRLEFRRKLPSQQKIREFDHLVVWGKGLAGKSVTDNRPVIHVEDGFVRSVGLGSDKALPSSLCFDSSTPFFDAIHASNLESLLNTARFSRALLERAKRLRHIIVAANITKYNLEGAEAPDYRTLAKGRPIVVVAGQVPGDASLEAGRALYRSNLALLATARRLRGDDAFIVYKEHPDLVANNRKGRESCRDLSDYADLVVGIVPVGDLLHVADEIHVGTSQLGFEAVLRERRVFCHGLPFYAGWGLTQDFVSPLRPRRRLGLDELVAGALILYPRYFNWETNCHCDVEDVVTHFTGARAQMKMIQQALDKGLL
jgi:capsular polysaccharide export protein